MNLFDVQSIEILRGSQGTLFGRNTTGGVILIILVSTKMNNFDYLNFSYAQRSHMSAEGAINRQLNENMAARLAFNLQYYEYSTNNLLANTPQAQIRQSHACLSVLVQWEKLTIDSKIYLNKWDGGVDPVSSIGLVKTFDPLTGLLSSFYSPVEAGSAAFTDAFGFNDDSNNFHDVAVNDIDDNSPSTTDSHGIKVKTQYKFNEQTYLISISNFTTLDREHYYNSDGSPRS